MDPFMHCKRHPEAAPAAQRQKVPFGHLSSRLFHVSRACSTLLRHTHTLAIGIAVGLCYAGAAREVARARRPSRAFSIIVSARVLPQPQKKSLALPSLSLSLSPSLSLSSTRPPHIDEMRPPAQPPRLRWPHRIVALSHSAGPLRTMTVT